MAVLHLEPFHASEPFNVAAALAIVQTQCAVRSNGEPNELYLAAEAALTRYFQSFAPQSDDPRLEDSVLE